MFGHYLPIYIEQEKLNSEDEFIEKSADATAINVQSQPLIAELI